MNEINALKAKLSPSFPKNGELNIKQFLDIENILYLAQQISPQLQASQAYLLLRGYHLIAHTQNNEQLYLMQQARIKWLSYSSRIQWEQFIEKYFSKDYDGIRLYENMDGLVQVSTKNIPVRNREEVYSSNLNEHKSSTNNLSFATEGRYTFHKKNKRIVTVSIDKEDLKLLPHGNRTHSGSRDRREPIMSTLTDLLNAANEMRTIVPGDYCYDVLNRNTIKAVDNHAIAPCQYLSIHEVVNIVGMVGSGKTTLIKTLCYYFSKFSKKVVVVLNSVNDVVNMYQDLRRYNINVVPLIGKGEQEKHINTLIKNRQMYLDEETSKFLATPCILNGACDNETEALTYDERPCFNLKSDKKYICPFFESCPGALMLREASSATVVVTTVAGLAASRIGTQKILFFEHVINQADVVLFDESDRVQKTLDDFFAPNISFLEFMESQADACAKDMKREPDAPETDVNATRYYDLVRETPAIYHSIVTALEQIKSDNNRNWKELISCAFSALSILRQLEKDGIDSKLIDSLRQCIYINHFKEGTDEFTLQLSETCNNSCRASIYEKDFNNQLKRLMQNNSLVISEEDLQHIGFLLKVIYFDRIMDNIDDSAKSIDNEILRENQISDFLQARFIAQQHFLPAAPMGNTFGMIYTGKKELKVYRQFAYGRYLMNSLPWLRVNEKCEPIGPHAILFSGSSYAPYSLQCHVNAPINYILESPQDARDYLSKSIFRTNGAFTVISGSGLKDRISKFNTLLKEISSDIKAEIARSGKILFVVNSYKESKEVMGYTNRLLSELEIDEKSVAVVDERTSKDEYCILKSDLPSFAVRKEKILIAPAAVIERGYNIVDERGNSAIRSIFFLVRPMAVPEDIALKISKLNGYIDTKYAQQDVKDWGVFCKTLVADAGKYWGMMEREYGTTLANLSSESKLDITATVFNLMLQLYGRSARVSDLKSIDKQPPRVYFADGAFNSNRGTGSYDIISEIITYLKNLMESSDGEIAKTLYETFYNALKENNNEQKVEDSTDEFLPETFYD